MNRPNKPIQKQRGAVAIMVGLSIAVLIGMIGLALDLGRMFVIKTELQNTADACALAAARELDGNIDALTRADNAGVLIGSRNEINFQDENAPVTAASLSYSAVLSPNSTYQSSGSASAATARYAMCTVARPNIGMLFMGVRGFGAQSVSAYAVATLAPSQTTCAIPLGMCKPSGGSSTAPFGLVLGQWYSGKFGSGGGESLTGSYNWIDFSPPAGGANELKDLLSGVGQCELPPVGTCVGEQGQKVGASDAWNTRFGLYKGSYNITNSPPDYTGLAYTLDGLGGADATTWPNPAPQNAYSGTPISGTTLNYEAAELAHSAYQSSDPSDVISGHSPSITPSGTLATNGQQRRIALAPVVDCGQLGSGTPGCPNQQVKILGYACVLMLNPIKGPIDVVVEYLGQPDVAGSPCGSYGLGGGSGPLVPVLVQ